MSNINLYQKIYMNAKARGLTDNANYVVIDFSKSSKTKRLSIIDSDTGNVIYSTYVTHGSGSGKGEIPTSFSNKPGSYATSIGVYNTKEYYNGKHGRVLRVNGLEKGYNDRAYDRYIEVHPADYIGNGKTGKSQGCFAVPTADFAYISSKLKPRTIIIAYFPDKGWLANSTFIK